MTPFLAAQAADPFDPVPMLIQADWLEERGDLAGAAVLRGLVGAGVPSLVALAREACCVSVPWRPDQFDEDEGYGWGEGDDLGDMDTPPAFSDEDFFDYRCNGEADGFQCFYTNQPYGSGEADR